MSNMENNLTKFPTSVQILGILTRALKVESDILNGRSARRYYEGDNVPPDRKIELFEEFSRVIVSYGILPELKLPRKQPVPTYELVAFTLLFYAETWDQLAGQIRSTPLREVPNNLGILPYLRLVVIDLSIRVVGLLRLAGLLRLSDSVPSWAEKKKHGTLLRDLQHKSGLSREQLAKEVELWDNTVDAWLESKSYPTDFNIDVLATVLSRHIIGRSEESVRAQLKRHYMLCRVCDLLAEKIDRQDVIELATHLVTYVNRLYDGFVLYSHLPEEQARAADMCLIMFGTRFTSAEYLTRSLWRQENDPVWSADLSAATKSWYPRLVQTSQYLSAYEEGVQWAKTHLPLTIEEADEIVRKSLNWIQGDNTKALDQAIREGRAIRIKGDAKFSANNRMIQAMRAKANGDNETAILHLRRAVELQPLNADYHFHLGATLGQTGKVEEGIQECKQSIEIKPDWDLPPIEIGIILGNNGRYEESRRHLEEIAKSFSMTSHLAFSLGYVRMHCNEFQGALDLFEIVLKEKPQQAQALDCAAHCCFMLGQGDRGLALAKEALKYGAKCTYQDWQNGKYKGSAREKKNNN